MLLRLFQIFCGFLACVMCIFILGPIAFIITGYRVVRNWILNIPHDYSDFEGIWPMFVTWCCIIAVVVGVSQI